MHLFFAAFVLGVPLFAVIVEIVGWRKKDGRFDKLAYEFTSLPSVAYATTAAFGGLPAFALFTLYPTFMGYMTGIFKATMFYYALLFFAASACLYIDYYAWHWLQGGFRKWVHLTVGLLLNAVGAVLMFLANAWLTFMMSPAGIDAAGVYTGDVWGAIHNHLWNPINLHRMIANIAYGGSIVGAYAAYKFPERAQYALFLLAVAFTWLMGLMGCIRSGIRQHWHVVGGGTRQPARRLHPDAGLRRQRGLARHHPVHGQGRLRVLAEPGEQRQGRARRHLARRYLEGADTLKERPA